jgi:hypothetical protein
VRVRRKGFAARPAAMHKATAGLRAAARVTGRRGR